MGYGHRDVTLSRPDKLSALSEEMYHGIAAQFSALDDLAVCGARLTHDHQEGVAAFKEKRPPRFTGR